ncbi:cadmium-translocating P-type ATPase [Massilia sp. G4R7]|uniref:Cadmium-translocating P-type ATPase n=1 Tax=Massilia phyllostachyos TaxID=2898585 RepID=A0ABS8Q9S8_9BURK|nr:heavy metal translocating P-type ATPase [Massilia phyllostachyos]MCD2518485.1 cadmium-translocating P-type ATPase [Massilia phyllostachyos]
MSAVLAPAMRDARDAGSEPLGCYHCGLPVPPGSRWEARVGGAARSMCCPGCAAAAEAIVDGGFGGYYKNRTEFAATAGGDADAPELALYDEAGEEGEGSFTIEGVRCGACVWLVERRLCALPGVREVALNVALGRVFVRWDPALCRPSVIVRALRRIGYAAYPYEAHRHDDALRRARRTLLRQLFVAGLAMMQVMMYAVPVYLADDGTMDADMRALMGWASFALTLPAVLYSALPFFQGAWRDLRRGMPGMDVPVALGIAAAFAASCASLVSGVGEVWFDSITMFIFLLLGSRTLELEARRRATEALDRLRRGAPASSLRLRGDRLLRDTELVPSARLAPGDLVLVKPGQAVPADGVVIEGETDVDVSLLSGESQPRPAVVGDALPGGAINAGQAIVVRVTSTAHESTLATLVRLVERAGQGKPALALWADRVAAWFVVALLLLTVAVYAVWQVLDPGRAWQAAIAVLVVSCPCALSLATPTALAAATDRLLRRGVLAVAPHTLETFERATHVVFDKTGTLTHGCPRLRRVLPVGELHNEICLRIAGALQTDSAHLLSAAIRAAMPESGLQARELRFEIGRGIEGSIDGVVYRIGSAPFVAELAGGMARTAAPPGITTVWLARAGAWLARFDLSDSLREEAREVVRRFRDCGKTVVLLSGDEQGVAQAVASQLGIAHAYGGRLPAEKLAFVRELQKGGAVVAMVGDGVNDAAVLKGADVSFAMGRGAELAQLHADGVLLGEGLGPLADAAETARRTLRIVRQNLAWATVYNLAAIPAAASGMLNPWLSGIGMALSSAVVVLNALRLRRG